MVLSVQNRIVFCLCFLPGFFRVTETSRFILLFWYYFH